MVEVVWNPQTYPLALIAEIMLSTGYECDIIADDKYTQFHSTAIRQTLYAY